MNSPISGFLLALIMCSFATQNVSAQIIIWSEDFENHGNTVNGGAGRYTSTNDFHQGILGSDDDYFGRVHGPSKEYYLTEASSGLIIQSNTPYTGWHGNFFYAGEDLDDIGGLIGAPDGLDVKEIIFPDIDIRDATTLTFKGLFARGETDACAASIYDNDDFIEVYYDVDGAGEVRALCFNPDIECNIPADITNEPLHWDPNCDGDGGDGTILTANLSEFYFEIPDGDSLDLKIRIHMDAGSEEIAFDWFRIEALSETILKDGFEAILQ